MASFSFRQYCFLLIDIVLLISCIVNAPLVLERAQIPFSILEDQGMLSVSAVDNAAASGGLRTGDRVISWNSQKITTLEIIEFFCDLSSVGDRAMVTVERSNAVLTSEISLVPYYHSPRFLIVSLFVGFMTWLVGVFILLQPDRNPAADLLHWGLVTLGTSIMITWGHIDPSSIFSGVSRAIFFICYTLAPALFVLFAAEYPRQIFGSLRPKVLLMLLVAVPLITAQAYTMWRSIYERPERFFPLFQSSFDLFNIYLLSCFVLMVFGFLYSYRRAVRTSDKRRLEWIMWGFCSSPVPFVLFIKLPQLAGVPGGLIAEEVTTFFFLLIPFSCVISLVQHNLVDIRIVISRSIIYTALSFFVGVIYSLTILLAATSVDTQHRFEEFLVIGGIVLLVALLLDPLRKKLHRSFDEFLFPARFHFRRTIAEVRDKLSRSLTSDDVFRTLHDQITSVLSFESFGMFEYKNGNLMAAGPNNGRLHGPVPIPQASLDTLQGRTIAALPSAVDFRSEEKIDETNRLPELLGCTICILMMTQSGKLSGAAAGKPSTVTGRFTEEETDLLAAVCSEGAETLERLSLQKEMIIQQAEKQRFEELNRMKSTFVSSVSHELRTPLTSIRMFAEMLRGKTDLPDRTRREYLQIIEGESERLTRLVDNVLDFSAIERNEKKYHFSEVDLADIIRRSALAVRYEFLKQDGRLVLSIAKRIPRLQADPDALEEVCINLLSNGLKYSPDHRLVRLRAGVSGRNAVIEVTDRGIGIPDHETGRIFDDFYRANDPQVLRAGGTGLGLSMVKHIVDAHGGTITVRSTVGKGSTFIVALPLKQRRST